MSLESGHACILLMRDELNNQKILDDFRRINAFSSHQIEKGAS
jgi:hypothetical protein